MLKIPSYRDGLPIFKALSSETRIMILELLQTEGPMSLTAISERLAITPGALTPHIRMMQECGLISIAMAEGKHGTLKICKAEVSGLMVSGPELSMTGSKKPDIFRCLRISTVLTNRWTVRCIRPFTAGKKARWQHLQRGCILRRSFWNGSEKKGSGLRMSLFMWV